MWQILKKVDKSPAAPGEKSPSVDDRRRLERIRMLLTINCQSHEHVEPFRIMTENVNTNGIKFVTSVKLYSGEVIAMKILLHSHFPNINVRGRVVWCDKKFMYGKSCYEGGIEFINMSEADGKYLQKFIDKHRVDDLDPAL
jgi:hypothetical protein